MSRRRFKVKDCIIEVLERHPEKIIETRVQKITRSGGSSKIALPWFFMKALARRVIIDDGDDIIIVLMINKAHLELPDEVDIKQLFRRQRKQPPLPVIDSPELAEEWMQWYREEIEKRRKRRERAEEAGEEG